MVSTTAAAVMMAVLNPRCLCMMVRLLVAPYATFGENRAHGALTAPGRRGRIGPIHSHDAAGPGDIRRIGDRVAAPVAGWRPRGARPAHAAGVQRAPRHRI